MHAVVLIFYTDMTFFLEITHYAALEFFFDPAIIYVVEEMEDLVNLTVTLNGDPGNFSVLVGISSRDMSSTATGTIRMSCLVSKIRTGFTL